MIVTISQMKGGSWIGKLEGIDGDPVEVIHATPDKVKKSRLWVDVAATFGAVTFKVAGED